MSFGFDLNDAFGGFAPPTPPDGCTQCGMCLSGCPTYGVSGDAEQSPMGRIRLMRLLEGDDELAPAQLDSLAGCLGCGSCELVCPSKVGFAGLLDQALVQVRALRPLPRITRAMQWLARRPRVLRAALNAVWLAQALGVRRLAGRLGVTRALGLARADALLDRAPRPGRLVNRVQRAGRHDRVALFSGCFGSVLEQEIQQDAIDVFNALGMEVVVPQGQGCCGALHRHNGDLDTAAALARANLAAFGAVPVDAIVSTSSGCGASLQDYGDWLDGDGLPAPVRDVSHYLAEALVGHGPGFETLPLKVALHTPCTLRRDADQAAAVQDLLARIPGLQVVPLSGEPRCCGAGGSQMLSEPVMADALRDQLVAEIHASGADVLVSANLGCAMHLRAGLAAAGVAMPLRHPVQLVAQALAV